MFAPRYVATILRPFAGASLMLAIAGCTTPGTTGDTPTSALPAQSAAHNALQPRAVGAVWEFASSRFENGKAIPISNTREAVIGFSDIGEQRVFLVRVTGDSNDSYFWDYTGKNGVYLYSDEGMSRLPPPASLGVFECIMAYPAEKGRVYEADGRVWVVANTKVRVTVPAGTFLCVEYASEALEADGWRNVYFMSPSVGLVKWQLFEQMPDGQWTLSAEDKLKSYSLR